MTWTRWKRSRHARGLSEQMVVFRGRVLHNDSRVQRHQSVRGPIWLIGPSSCHGVMAMDLSPETIAGLILYRDSDRILHCGPRGLPESFAVTQNTLTILTLRHRTEASVVGDRLIIRTDEDVAVYDLTPADSTGVVAAVRCA
jgi:hypothetical protein